MPVIKSAKKKLRQDKKRTAANTIVEEAMKKAIKAARKNPSIKTLSLAFKTTDKAVKKYVIHKNKAARIKSSLSKLLSPKNSTPVSKAKVKPIIKKSAEKKSTKKHASKSSKKSAKK